MKTVLITGASQGLGYEFAKIFANNAYHLVLAARNRERLAVIVDEIKKKYTATEVTAVVKDLSLPNAPEEIFQEVTERHIQVDVLVNNAGFATHGLFPEIPMKDEQDEIQVNITAVTVLTKLFSQEMVKRRQGRILNVASTAAFLPGPFMAVYYASKAYVVSFSEAVAEELFAYGITVTTLCPGPMHTGFAKRAGIVNVPLFTGKLTAVEYTAQVGYEGLMKGKRIVVVGMKSQLQVNAIPFLPREWVAKVVAHLQR